ncbi:hypothetical protein GW17_00045250 [Ensete ventricosum]|nr:hypothetical protein GW17_00045250 [Ensete ventricosum]RZR87386.1 hypothetical protein BHM03_00014783 [Ensete ventricosum]
MFEPIIPLYGISFKVDGSDVHHGNLRGSMKIEVARAQKPSCWIFIFPSREVHPHAWLCSGKVLPRRAIPDPVVIGVAIVDDGSAVEGDDSGVGDDHSNCENCLGWWATSMVEE